MSSLTGNFMNSFDKHHLNDNHCFLCGELLSKKNRSDEHVIPEWIQREHNLWDKKLALLNHTLIPYRQLKIPCCRKCNNESLSQMENEISKFLKRKFESPTKQDEYKLFQWASKILYGLLYKEMSLASNLAQRATGSIVPKEFLENLLTFHHFMTSIQRPFNFVNFTPYSIFIVETLTFDDSEKNFDYFDFVTIGNLGNEADALMLALRVQHYGIICVFQDNGFQKQFFQKQFDRFQGIPLHPIQFLELACKTAYKHSLLTFSPRYSSLIPDFNSNNSEITVIPITFPDENIWASWDNDTYEKLFFSIAKNTGFGALLPDSLYIGEKHLTWLDDGHGNPLKMI